MRLGMKQRNDETAGRRNVRPRFAGRCATLAALAIAIGAWAGCGPQFGAFLYFFGNHPKQTVQAKFKLTTGPLLILFDDSPAVDLPPEMRDLTVKALTDEFKRNGINDKVVPQSRVNEIRQTHRDLDKRGMREVGRLVEAEQVLWLFPREFAMANTPEQALDPAKLTVVLKVIDAKATERSKVRAWPVGEEGELVSITIDANKTRSTKSNDELYRLMSQEIAVEIGHLFRDYDEGRPEDK